MCSFLRSGDLCLFWADRFVVVRNELSGRYFYRNMEDRRERVAWRSLQTVVINADLNTGACLFLGLVRGEGGGVSDGSVIPFQGRLQLSDPRDKLLIGVKRVDVQLLS